MRKLPRQRHAAPAVRRQRLERDEFAEHQTLVERVALEFEKSPHHPFDRPSI